MGKLTISMTIFNSKLLVYQRVLLLNRYVNRSKPASITMSFGSGPYSRLLNPQPPGESISTIRRRQIMLVVSKTHLSG